METRDAYIDKMGAKLKEWSTEIDKLAAKLVGATAEGKADLLKQINELKQKRGEAEKKTTRRTSREKRASVARTQGWH